MQAASHNENGDIEGAKNFGQAALCCNLLTLVFYFAVIIVIIVLVVLYFVAGVTIVSISI